MSPAPHSTTKTDPRIGARRPHRSHAGTISLALLAAVLIAFGWDRGPDVLVDFGRELYVPWRLVEGEHLHSDIAWFNGPLAPWTIAAWMEVFGVSVDALQALNAAVIALALALLVAILRTIAGELAAWTGGAVFLMVFAVAQQEAIGNFLFLAPYSHGITFGFACSLVALWALERAVRTGSSWPPLIGGAALGLVLLTKAEMSLAAAASCGTMLVAMFATGGSRGRRGRLVALFLVGALLPVGAAYLRFVAEIGAERAPRALAGTWPYVLDDRARDLPFYRTMRGTDDPAFHLARMARYAAGTTLFVSAVLLAARALGSRLRGETFGYVAALGLGGGATFLALLQVEIEWLLVPLPLVLAALFILSLRRSVNARATDDASGAILQLGFVVFAAALLPKVLLSPLARQYGFVLSIPGTLLTVAALVHWIPSWIADRRPRAARRDGVLRAASVGVVLAFAMANLFATAGRFRAKNHTFGSGPDQILCEGWRGTVLSALARDLGTRLGPDDSLLVLPEGIMLNYELRRRTPTRVVNFMPPELVFFDEAEIVTELESNPPAAVALVHRPTDVYGHPFFGDGYGEIILAWVLERYERVRLIGDEPLEEGIFGAAVLVPRSTDR